MMKLSTQVDSKSDHNNNSSDLTTIRGIGVSRKRWLNSLGIYTIAELSQASVHELESQLKKDGRLPSHNELEEWIAQARSATATHQQPEPPSHEPDVLPEPELTAAPALTAASTPDWNSVAAFKVEYQTRQTANKLEQRTVIYHFETGTTESWTDFESQSVQPWMLDQIKTTVSQPEIASSVIPEITQLKLIQPCQSGQAMSASKTQPLFFGEVQADESFALEVSIKFTELTDTHTHEQIAWKVKCVVYDVSTASTTTLGEVIVNVPLANNSSYNALLPELMLPHAGIYRLKVFVSLQNQLAANAEATSGCFKVPILQGV